jgi:hypothetical protein
MPLRAARERKCDQAVAAAQECVGMGNIIGRFVALWDGLIMSINEKSEAL